MRTGFLASPMAAAPVVLAAQAAPPNDAMRSAFAAAKQYVAQIQLPPQKDRWEAP